ncbi:MAG: peptide deformylase [Gammaproteobacteria bacterium]|nr:MAG: peptide deformylase [Gammaproteobacteria bacterium]
MALLNILQYPDPRLRIKAAPVTNIDEVRRYIDDMYETMYHAQGLGLAATQVNIHQRFFVMDLSEKRDQPVSVFNPEILSQEGVQDDFHGCLSVGAGISDKVKRAAKLRLRGIDLEGKTFEWDLEGLAAICIQHEVDHLNGILFIDHLSKLKQERIRKKIEKFQRQA